MTMKNLRTEMKLTQRELAALTGVSTSIISLYEKGLRSLPAKVSIKLTELSVIQQQMSRHRKARVAPTLQFLPSQKNKLDALLQSDMSKAAFDTLRYNRTLEQMQERYTALLAKLELIQPLKQAAETGTTRMAILEWMEILTLDKMQRCSPVKQAAVQYRLLQCEAQKKCVNAMLAKLKKIK